MGAAPRHDVVDWVVDDLRWGTISSVAGRVVAQSAIGNARRRRRSIKIRRSWCVWRGEMAALVRRCSAGGPLERRQLTTTHRHLLKKQSEEEVKSSLVVVSFRLAQADCTWCPQDSTTWLLSFLVQTQISRVCVVTLFGVAASNHTHHSHLTRRSHSPGQSAVCSHLIGCRCML